MRSSSLSSCVCECGRLLLLLLRVSLKRAFLENGPRWQETSQGGTLQVCMSQHVGSLAEEADTLIKSYLEPLLIVPSGVSSLTSYHTHPRVGHALDYVCVHALPYEPLKITQRCILFIIVVIMSSSCVTRYSIDRSSDPDKYFYIEITSGSLMTVRSLDREEVGWHNITILAMEMSTSYTHANKDTSGCN